MDNCSGVWLVGKLPQRTGDKEFHQTAMQSLATPRKEHTHFRGAMGEG